MVTREAKPIVEVYDDIPDGVCRTCRGRTVRPQTCQKHLGAGKVEWTVGEYVKCEACQGTGKINTKIRTQDDASQ